MRAIERLHRYRSQNQTQFGSSQEIAWLCNQIDVSRQLLQEARDELDKHGYGDFHYGPTPRDPGVLAMIAKIDEALNA